MKKKILILSIGVAVLLTACGGRGSRFEVREQNVEETEKETEDEVSDEGADDVTADDRTDSEPSVSEAEPEEDQKEDDAGEAEEGYVRGTVSEQGWESEYFALRYTAPEDMGMATEEYLNQIMGIGMDMLSESFTEQQLEYAEMRTIYEMMSLDTAGSGFNVLVMAEKLPLINMSNEQYKRSFVQQLSKVEGATLISDDEVVDIAGEEYVKVCSEVEAQGAVAKQNYYFRVIDDRALSIVITYTDDTEEMVDTVINAFEVY